MSYDRSQNCPNAPDEASDANINRIFSWTSGHCEIANTAEIHAAALHMRISLLSIATIARDEGYIYTKTTDQKEDSQHHAFTMRGSG